MAGQSILLIKKECSIMKKDVMILTGAGQIGMVIARRMGYGKNCHG